MMNLQTERLLLREFVREDVHVLHQYSTHPALQRFEQGPPVSEFQFHRIVQDIIAEQSDEPRRSFYFVVERLADSRVMGSVYIAQRNQDREQAEIGYMLGVDFWNEGYATEAADCVIQFGFEVLRLHRIYAEAVCENLASIRVLGKLNMRREGVLRENQYFHSRWWDTCMYALLRHEWADS
ncbi:MAG: GNAT family N-acetyltransferase [Anaerolineae bacterium]|nr:GNAT family N-acetyltransferase [Anaerolineae bacterium]